MPELFLLGIDLTFAESFRTVCWHHEASGQGFLSMIRGLGQFVGLCIGGFLEGRILYRILAAIVTVGSVILAIGNHICNSSRGSSSNIW
jgi:hypothetical protein